jgi:putative transposase
LEEGRHVERDSRYPPRTGAEKRRTPANLACRDHRQAIRQDDGRRGLREYVAGKQVNGRKRQILLDAIGLLLTVVVRAANVQERDGTKQIFEKARGCFPRHWLVWRDGGYAGKLLDWLNGFCGWTLEIVKRVGHGFQVLPRRWVVERMFDRPHAPPPHARQHDSDSKTRS